MQAGSEQAIPLVQEQLELGKRLVETDHVQVVLEVEERPVLIEKVIDQSKLRVERFQVERSVDRAPEPRQEGNTLIISVVEERPVVVKRLFVIEEVHITRESISEDITIPETIRRMKATVEHAGPID